MVEVDMAAVTRLATMVYLLYKGLACRCFLEGKSTPDKLSDMLRSVPGKAHVVYSQATQKA